MGANDERQEPDRDPGGLHVIDLLSIAEPSRQVLKWMLREGETRLLDVAAGMGWDESTTLSVLTGLVADGLVTETVVPSETRYRVHLAHQRARGSGREVWRRLGETGDD